MGWRDNLRNPKNLGVIRGPHGHASQPHLSVHAKGGRIGKFGGGRTNLLEELGRVEGERSNPNRRAEISRVHGELNRGYNKGGRVGLKHGGKPWGAGPKPGTHEFLQHHLHKRKGKATGSIVKGMGALAKKFKKKKVYPETEDLTHQVGPYAGDVGSEGKKRRAGPQAPGRPKAPGPKGGRSWGGTPPGRHRKKVPEERYAQQVEKKAKGGRIGLKHGFQALGGGIKGKPHSTREGRDDAGRRRFKRIFGEDWSKGPGSRRMGRPGRGKDFKTHGRDVTTMAAKGGRIGLKKGGSDKNWIQKATASIKKRGTKGKCTPITKKGCTGRAKALAKTFKKMAAKRKS